MKHLPKWLEESLPEAVTPNMYSDGQDDTVPRITVLDMDLVNVDESTGTDPYDTGVFRKKAGGRPNSSV